MISTITLSSKNQITIPKAILNIFGIKSGEKLLVQAEADAIKIKPMGTSIIEQLVGSVKIDDSKKGIPFEKVLEFTKRKVARELARK